MSADKFTPGPWTVTNLGHSYGAFQIKEWCQRERSVLRGFEDPRPEASIQGEREANRLLISAAPEMLAALQLARKAVEISATQEARGALADKAVGLSERLRTWRDAIKLVDAAIARATGQ